MTDLESPELAQILGNVLITLDKVDLRLLKQRIVTLNINH